MNRLLAWLYRLLSPTPSLGTLREGYEVPDGERLTVLRGDGTAYRMEGES